MSHKKRQIPGGKICSGYRPAPEPSEALWLRGALRHIADAVGVPAALLGRPALRMTLEGILARIKGDALLRENIHWREYAWLSCPHASIGKYADDGEMQCRGADFRRWRIEDLSEHLRLARVEGRDAAYEAAADELVAQFKAVRAKNAPSGPI